MPELPEMETYKSFCNDFVKGNMITAIEVSREKSLNVPSDEFRSVVCGHRIVNIERRAKHLIFRLDHGMALLLHLMLGGWMFFGSERDRPDRTIQVQLTFGNSSLYFIGLRLGYLHLKSEEQLQDVFRKLGPEPLEPNFRAQAWLKRIQSRSGALKTTLVDQSFVAGIGNCYSDEMCWHAGILPYRKCRELSQEEQLKLYTSMRELLREAVGLGGYMEHPFTVQDKHTGGYNAHCKVYDEEDKPCRRCGHLITKDTFASRKMFYCKGCQR